jgi:hypothetical protein
MSRKLEALTSWNPVGLFRPVMGLIYLITVWVVKLYRMSSRKITNGKTLDK